MSPKEAAVCASHADPDIIGLTRALDWRHRRQLVISGIWSRLFCTGTSTEGRISVKDEGAILPLGKEQSACDSGALPAL